jgi:hypothetical protein
MTPLVGVFNEVHCLKIASGSHSFTEIMATALILHPFNHLAEELSAQCTVQKTAGDFSDDYCFTCSWPPA